LTRFDDYAFAWSDPESDAEMQNKYTGSPLIVFLVGLSHSREMMGAMSSLNISSDNITYHWVRSRYPDNIVPGFVQRLIDLKCSKTVVAVGQWAASKKVPGGQPYLFETWELRMREVIGLLKNASIDTLFRSIHDNPISEIGGSCPLTDWRSPPVIDGYNAVLEKLTKELDVPYVDSNKYFIGPGWDSAPDWCHVQAESGQAEAQYVFASIIKQRSATHNLVV